MTRVCVICGIKYDDENGRSPDCPNLHSEKNQRLLLLENTVVYLWGLLDDIDTASDMAKSDDKLYRHIVERRQKMRWETGIKCNGYTLDLSNIKNMKKTDEQIDEDIKGILRFNSSGKSSA